MVSSTHNAYAWVLDPLTLQARILEAVEFITLV